MNRPGFTIIELLVATMVASILGTLLVQMLFQVNRVSTTADDRMTTDERAMVMFTQLERDLSGAFIPEQKEPEEKKDSEKSDEKKEAKLTKIFFGDGRGSVLTFITNNPLPTYWDARVSKPKTAIARVVYTLTEDQKLKGSFNLDRFETEDITDVSMLEKEHKQHFMRLASGIKELKLQFIEQKDRQKEQQKEEPSAPPKPGGAQKPAPKAMGATKKEEPAPIIEYAPTDEWDTDKKVEEQKGVFRHQLPAFVKIQIALWDNRKKGTTQFEYMVSVVPDKQVKKGFKSPQEQEKPGEKKTSDQPGDKKDTKTPTKPSGADQ